MDTTEEQNQRRSRSCSIDDRGHCITCSDEAVLVRIVEIDAATQQAQVEVQGQIEEVDISLLDRPAVGSYVLVHGGVALEQVAADAIQKGEYQA